MLAALAWTLFAFGGLYTWALVPLAAILVSGLIVVRPVVVSRDVLLDAAVITAVTVVAFQLVPLTIETRRLLSPHAERVEQSLELDQAAVSPARRPLSIRPSATAASIGYLAAVLSMFWLARSIFERSGTSAVIRGLGWIGILVSVLAIVQLAATPLLFYGQWRPEDPSARPFGPFVNRNHMATWLLLAIPLTGGYMTAHLRSRLHNHPGLARAMDSTTIWQIGAGVITVSALLVSLSRSGVIGLGAATITGFALARLKLGYIKVKWVAGAAVLAVLTVTYLANFDALATRFSRALDLGSERSEIWRQTVPIVRDFALTGTGQGTFNRAMLVYQSGDRQLLFNQAHNQYLQIAAEGGLLVGLPTLCAILALIVGTVRRLRTDTTVLFWTRAGAAAALVAVAIQSVWETGLRMPANGLLFAVCAALAVHESRKTDE